MKYQLPAGQETQVVFALQCQDQHERHQSPPPSPKGKQAPSVRRLTLRSHTLSLPSSPT